MDLNHMQHISTYLASKVVARLIDETMPHPGIPHLKRIIVISIENLPICYALSHGSWIASCIGVIALDIFKCGIYVHYNSLIPPAWHWIIVPADAYDSESMRMLRERLNFI